MKSRKLVSLICAAALASTAVASMVVTASADDSVLWSDTFDGYENIVEYYHANTLPDNNKVLVDGTLVAGATYEGIDGITLKTTSRADDSSYWQLTEDEGVGKAITTQISRFARQGAGAELIFNGEAGYTPSATEDVVLAFKVYVSDAGETGYDRAVEINGAADSAINLDAAVDTWTDVKVVITPSGTKAYVGGAETALNSITKLGSIKFNSRISGARAQDAVKAASNPLGYPTVSFDDMVVYKAAAGTGKDSTVPAAETHGEVEVEYETVPAGVAPVVKIDKKDVTLGRIAADNFNNKATQRYVFINKTEEDSTDSTSFDTVTVFTGTDNDTHGETKWEVVGNTKTDPTLGTEKYLKAYNSVKSTANRGPKLQFKINNTDADGNVTQNVGERQTYVVQFATRLHKSETAPAEVIFSGDLVASESKGNIASPLAMITTDATAASGVYTVDHPLKKVADGGENVLEIADNTWALVQMTATRSEGKSASVKIDVTVNGNTTTIYDGLVTDSTGHGVNNIPYVSFRSGNDADYGVSNTTNDIDNIAIYASTKEAVASHEVEVKYEDGKATVATAETDPFDAKVIYVSYKEDKTISTVKVFDVSGISAETPKSTVSFDAKSGDKLFVWNTVGAPTPFCEAYTVQ